MANPRLFLISLHRDATVHGRNTIPLGDWIHFFTVVLFCLVADPLMRILSPIQPNTPATQITQAI
jgi:hypothetical protein